MRSLAFSTLLAGIATCTGLTAQSLTEHAAAAGGATIGTAAGKPLGTSLGKIFGDVDKNASAAATPKNAKPVPAATKPSPVPPPAAAKSQTAASTGNTHSVGPMSASGAGNDAPLGGGGGSSAAPLHHSAHRSDPPAEAPVPVAAAALVPVLPVVTEPVIRQVTPQDVARIQVGASGSDVRAALGPPASTVSIPGDDGHLLEICQYWANGAQVGTVRLDNGRVVSVKTSN